MSETLIAGSLTIFILIIFILLFISEYQRRRSAHVKEKQKMQFNFQQELLRTQLEIQEQTLKTISQEIHDNIGQVLSLAKLNLNRMDISKHNELEEKIKDSKNLVSKAIQDLRDLSKTLNTDNIAAIGLIRAIEYELEMIRKTGSHQTSLETEGHVVRLEGQNELIVFRIVQEVLNNIIKHAEAGSIRIKASYSEDKMSLLITDDGKGVDLSPLYEESNNNNFGLGIRNMHSRAKLINGDFSMNSAIGKGTSVKLVVPLNNYIA